MSRILTTLIVDDDKEVREGLHKLLNNKTIDDITINTVTADFPEAINRLKHSSYDLMTLDLCKGDPSHENEKTGLDILKEIQSLAFIPVIFYTGLPNYVEDLKSPVVKVVNKNDGIEVLKAEISNLNKSKLLALKQGLHYLIEDELKQYFWNIIHDGRASFNAVETETSLSYLITRRISHALSKEKIKSLLKDEKIKMDKIHPMEFYVYPIVTAEYETGEILKKDGEYFVILTPSCDFVEDKSIKRDRKVGMVLLAETMDFKDFPEYKTYMANKNKDNKNKLGKVITSGKSDRYYFLPGTPFIDAQVVDFQLKKMVDYSELAGYNRVALIDAPFTQAMIASFIRFYNRIGSPDLDADYIINSLG